MAFNINLDLNAFIVKIQNSAYGLEFICGITTVIVLVTCIYFLAKSGVVSGIRDYSDHRRKKRNEIIAEQVELLEDKILKDYENDLEYHIKVSKLENYLNITSKDLDLLTYILSCRDRVKAVRLYKIAKEYLEKDENSCVYRLKPKYTEKRLKVYSYLGTILYICINIIGSGPYLYLNFLKYVHRDTDTIIANSVYISLFIFFIILFIFSMYVLWSFLKPEAAKNFLKLEKIVGRSD